MKPENTNLRSDDARTFDLGAVPWIWSLVALLTLLSYNAVFVHGFFSLEVRDGRLYGSLINILTLGAPVILMSLGMTLVIATGGVDLSVGAVVAISGAIAAQLITGYEINFYAALLIATLAGLLLGIWNGVLVALFRVQPIVATLTLMVAGRGLAQLIVDSQIVAVADSRFPYLSTGNFLGLPFSVTVVAAALILTILLIRGSAMGLFIEAIGNNERASHCAGLNVRGVKLFAYAFSGLCAGVAGLLVAANVSVADAAVAGRYAELDAILAVVIGGTSLTGGRFSLIGSLIGALIIQTLTSTILGSNQLPVEANSAIKAVVVLGVCLLQSRQFRAMFRLKRRSI